MRTAIDSFGQIDILVNVAGGSAGVFLKSKHSIFAESSPDRWREIIDLNLRADDDLTWSVRAGVDIGFGQDSHWAAVGGLRYISSDVDLRETGAPASDTESISADLFNFTVGVAYSF